jgi:hypothetical protein
METTEENEEYIIGAFGIRFTKSMIEKALSVYNKSELAESSNKYNIQPISKEEFTELAKLVGFSDEEIKLMLELKNE